MSSILAEWSSVERIGLVVAAVAVLLALGSAAAWLVRRRGATAVADLGPRVRSWWWMCGAVFVALFLGPVATALLFAFLSFIALREIITLTPTRRGDHHTLFWCFFVVLPLHYWFLIDGWVGMMLVFIPVWVFLFIALRSAVAGDPQRYMERVSRIQWGVMLAVYGLSHVPALHLLDIPGFAGRGGELVLWLLLTVQLSDVFQYVWGKSLGRHRIIPAITPSKTWEGLVGGVLTAAACGAGLWWLTPFTPWQAAALALGVALMGFAGGLVLSAVKRDAGQKDFAVLIPGHGGVLDRVDGLTFAAPALFHVLRYAYWP